MTVNRFLFLLANFWITTSICVLVVAARRQIESTPPVFADWKSRGELGHASPGIVQLVYSPDGTKLACVDHFVHPLDMHVSYIELPPYYLRILEIGPRGAKFRSSIEIPNLSLEGFSDDSRRVEVTYVDGGKDVRMASWDIEQLRLDSRSLGHPFSSEAGLYAMDGDYDNAVDILRMDDDVQVARIDCPEATISSWKFTSDGRYLLLHAHLAENKSQLIVWNVSENRRQYAIDADLNWSVQSFSPDGALHSVGDEETTIGLFETATGKLVRRVDAKSVNLWCAAFSPDNRYFAVGFESAPDSDVVAIVCDIATGEIVNSIHDRESWVTALVFSPDSQTLATGDSNGTIRFWSPATASELAEQQEEIDEVVRNEILSGGL